MLRHSIPRNDKRVFAFTLAEVLITLTIIGVIAALTIPNLMQSWTKQALKAELKKAYNEINTVSQKFTYEHNQTMYEYCKENNETNANGEVLVTSLPLQISKYMKLVTYTSPFDYSAMTNAGYLIRDNAKTLNNMAINHTLFDDGYFKDNRGREWFLEYDYTGPYISVDLNGINKGPNRWGYDIFTFHSQRNNQQITPLKDNIQTYCSYASTDKKNGFSCSYYALYDISPLDSQKTYWEDFLK